MRYKIDLVNIQPLWDKIPGNKDIGSIQDDGSVIVYDSDIERFNNNPIKELVDVPGSDSIIQVRNLDDYCSIVYGTTFSDKFSSNVELPFEIYNHLSYVPSDDERYQQPFGIDFKSDLVVKPTKMPISFDRKGNPKSKEYRIGTNNIAKRDFSFTFFTKEEMMANSQFLPILQYIASSKGLPQVTQVYESIADQLADHLIWTREERFRFAYEGGEYSEEYKPAPMDYVTFQGTIDLVSYYNFRKHERITGRDNIVTNLEPVVVLGLINSEQFENAHDAQVAGVQFLETYGQSLESYVKSGNDSIIDSIKNDTLYPWLEITLPDFSNVSIRTYIVNRLKQLPEEEIATEI